jgi:dinuclear metal center YbgI/SA1388 family protein
MNLHVADIVSLLESWAPPALQESYDNAALITGNLKNELTGVLVTLDCTEDVVHEAITCGCNLIVSHHPIVFSGLKRITGKTYVERAVIAAIKNDISIYAIHTNLDNVHDGVNARISELIGLSNTGILAPKTNQLLKLITFVPHAHLESVSNAVFAAGAGHIGHYSECSFSHEGHGTFKAGDGTSPYVGEKGKRHTEPESRLEVIVPAYLQYQVITALKSAHPYEEVAYDLIPLANSHGQIGAGMIGELEQPLTREAFLARLKKDFNLKCIRYTQGPDLIKKVAVCGGAGSFLIKAALQAGVDAYVTADVKYHEFFDAENRMMIADIGHYESEFFTKALIRERILEKFPTFAVLLSEINTNPINYYQ